MTIVTDIKVVELQKKKEREKEKAKGRQLYFRAITSPDRPGRKGKSRIDLLGLATKRQHSSDGRILIRAPKMHYSDTLLLSREGGILSFLYGKI